MSLFIESFVSTADSGGQRAVYLHDKSTNGVFLNGVKIGKGNKVIARSGNIVSFVIVPLRLPDGTYRCDDPQLVSAAVNRSTYVQEVHLT